MTCSFLFGTFILFIGWANTSMAQCDSTNNLIPNASFEKTHDLSDHQPIHWWVNDGGMCEYSDEAIDGDSIFCFYNGSLHLENQIRVDPNSTYIFKCWVKNGSEGSLTSLLKPNHSAHRYLNLEINTNEWQEVESSFETDELDSLIYIDLIAWGKYSPCIDMARLYTCENGPNKVDVNYFSTTKHTVRPNPTNLNSQLILSQAFVDKTISINLYNQLGCLVTSNTYVVAKNGMVVLEKNKLPFGTYNYHITYKNQSIGSGSWVIN